MVEPAVGDLSAAVNQQFGVVALFRREECDSLFRQVVVEVFDANVSGFCHSGGKSKNKNRPLCPDKRKKVYFCSRKKTGYSVVRLSRLLWEQEVACSNQAIPTSYCETAMVP